ncbi:PHP domain-containing protein [Rubeoparvulum massiliense]|uniref:PHP domain-containing protein n=1 Tax=Rubeoparvulum massiliense TaxID=1631346 RepID=UPI00065E4A36|nr:PHP domain-containing protein [Rubeoparvulum massiliense]
MKHYDLHTHSTASDGVLSPSEVVKRAGANGLSGIALTDHDTVAGLSEAEQTGIEIGVEVVKGIEISTLDDGKDIHVLGYEMDIHNQDFLKKCEELQHVRDRRNEMMIARLQELGISITLEEVVAQKGSSSNIGRPHMAQLLIEKGIVSSMPQAFKEYLGVGGKAYVTPPRIRPEEAIQMIHAAGGVAVLAHPGLYGKPELIPRLVEAGLDGIEIWHSDHNRSTETEYLQLAEEYGLLTTAGSDFHGERHGEVFHGDIGSKKIDETVVEQIQALARERKTFEK